MIRALGSSTTPALGPLDHLGRRLDRDEVGLGEVAVVLRLLLGAQRRRVLLAGHEVERLLLDLAAGLVDRDLAPDLALDPLRCEVERVDVLELGARAQLIRPLRPDGDVDVEAHRALLHLSVRDAELPDRLAQQLEEALGLLGRAEVGLGDDLDQRRSCAVEVHQRPVGAVDPARAAAHVHVLCRVLLEMRTHDPHVHVSFGPRHEERTAYAQRLVVLGDLIPLGVVRVEVVLAVEDGVIGDVAAECEPELDRPLDGLLVRHRQDAGMRQADRTGLRVRAGTEPDRAAAEHLRLGLQMDVDLTADDGFPVHEASLGGT